jgi:hypothetical protein
VEGFQLNKTVCGTVVATAVAVKFTLVLDAPLMDTEVVEGVNV